MIVTAACSGGASIASMNLQFASSPESGKTAYIGVTSAMASIAACASAAVGTALQPHLETLLGPGSIPLLFLLAGLGVLVIALVLVRGQNFWLDMRNSLFGVFGIMTYILGPFLLYLAYLVPPATR